METLLIIMLLPIALYIWFMLLKTLIYVTVLGIGLIYYLIGTVLERWNAYCRK